MVRPAHLDVQDKAPLGPVALLTLLVGMAAAKHVMVGLQPGGFLHTGLLVDADSWTRALRVLELWQGGGWFDDRVSRLDAPTGLSLHWTRPLDVLILLPAQVLHRVFGWGQREAVLAAGAWICPALHAACAVAAVRAASAVWTGIGPALAGLLVIANPVIGGYSGLGRADHHTLVVLAGLLALGEAMRAAARPEAHGAAWRAGAFAGLGVWVSPEALLFAAPVLAGFGAVWIAGGPPGRAEGNAAAQGLRASLGFAAAAAAGVLSEHAPSAWLAGDYDKVSAQHVLMGALGAAVFAVAARTGGAALRRAAVGGSAAAIALGALLASRPEALLMSLGGVDDAAASIGMVDAVAENQPVDLSFAGLVGETPWLLGVVPAALLTLALAPPVLRREGRLAALAPLGLALAVTLPTALLHRRVAIDLAVPACLLAAGLPGLALRLRRPAPRAAAALLAMALVLCVPFVGVLGTAAAAGDAGTAAPARSTEECGADALAALGGGRRGAADPVLLPNSVNIGPELAWRTPFRLVAGPYHRAGRAVVETVEFFGTADDAAARAIAARRNAAFVLICSPSPDEGGADASLLGRLRRGETPEWLAPEPLPGAPDGVRLFSVLPAAAESSASER